jgi:hypothetical protein
MWADGKSKQKYVFKGYKSTGPVPLGARPKSIIIAAKTK